MLCLLLPRSVTTESSCRGGGHGAPEPPARCRRSARTAAQVNGEVPAHATYRAAPASTARGPRRRAATSTDGAARSEDTRLRIGRFAGGGQPSLRPPSIALSFGGA